MIMSNCSVSQCERKCCNAQSDGNYELTGYAAFIEGIRNMKQEATNPTYRKYYMGINARDTVFGVNEQFLL